MSERRLNVHCFHETINPHAFICGECYKHLTQIINLQGQLQKLKEGIFQKLVALQLLADGSVMTVGSSVSDNSLPPQSLLSGSSSSTIYTEGQSMDYGIIQQSSISDQADTLSPDVIPDHPQTAYSPGQPHSSVVNSPDLFVSWCS